MMNWNTRIDCCNWDGVTCNHFTGDVIGLDLSCGMLQGTIHPNTTLFNLPHLQTLNLAYNHFSPSQLPHGTGKFSNSLTHLNISNCWFTGQIPSDIFNLRYLEKLDLSNNRFTGQIPSEISLLSKLVSLDLSWNRLDLQLQIQPHVFNNLLRNCTLLRDLSLADVNLSYVLPTNYLNISSSLKSLDLSYTSLQGKLPDNIFNLQYLEKLDLSSNSDLTGPLPKVNTSTSLPLKWLDLSFTRLSGEIPDSIGHLKSLNVLQLSSCGLMGPLPKFLVNLTYLTTLDLSFNMLNGTLPSWLFTLPSLENIILYGNMFYGTLPSELFALGSLKQLSLGNNQFVGKITQQTFQQLVNLTYLDLSFNNFKGDWELDTLLSSLTTLVNLDLSYSGLSVITHNDANHYINPDFQSLSLASCKLTVFPESLRSKKNLWWLDLSSNEIHGHIPDWVGEIGGIRLYHLNLSHNFITGLPQQFQWDGLEELYIQSNLIQGPFPPSICNLKDLVSLDMSNNSFSGVIPQCFGNISYSLDKIDLHSNLIHGPFPPSICNLSNLWYLDMSNNSFSGVIPQCFGNTSFFSLESIDLHSNLIQGPFPPAICNLSNLRYLDMSDNSFSGVIPQCFGNTSFSLWMIDLHSNLIQGPFPPSICNMKDLVSLDISNNSFSGVIPQCFGNTSFSLQMIDMGNNHFHGKMPNVENCSLLSGLILNGNQLEGEVPSFLSKCRSLEVLDLGNNHFDGTFPDWLGQLSKLKVLVLKSNKLHGPIESSSMIPHPFPSLKILDLSQNKFVGHLPGYYFQNFDAMKDVVKNGTKPEYLSLDGRKFYTIIVTVKDLQLVFSKILVDYTIVDLSNNKFEGEIPNVINSLNSLKVFNLSHNKLSGRIPYALGNLSEIESLDLSWNQLTGEIPQSLVDLTTLEVINLSQNHLVGRIPQGKQFNTFEGNSFEGNSGLCGFPLSKHCEHLSSPQLEANEDEESGFTWKAVMLGYGCGTLVGLAMGYVMLSTGRPKWFNAIADAGEQMIQRRRNKRRFIHIKK